MRSEEAVRHKVRAALKLLGAPLKQTRAEWLRETRAAPVRQGQAERLKQAPAVLLKEARRAQ